MYSKFPLAKAEPDPTISSIRIFSEIDTIKVCKLGIFLQQELVKTVKFGVAAYQ